MIRGDLIFGVKKGKEAPSPERAAGSSGKFTEIGNGWKGALEITQPSSSAQAGAGQELLPGAGDTGTRPAGVWMSPERETPHPP